jgi:hypothetical protein
MLRVAWMEKIGSNEPAGDLDRARRLQCDVFEFFLSSDLPAIPLTSR